MRSMLAMILAGGRGKRIDILSHERPKPALPFAGRFRVIDFTLSNCIHSQIANIAVLADYERLYMANYLKRWNSANAMSGGFHILEPRAGSYKGTADAVYQNLDYLQGYGNHRVLILAGDHVYKMDYRKMLTSHERAKADVTVGVVRIPIEQAHRFGIVTTDSEGRIIDFVEKPRLPASNLASMGIYLFNMEVLARRLIEDAAQPESPHDFGYAIIPRMVPEDKVFAYEFDGYWQDIGTKEAYYTANMELIGQRPSFNLNGGWHVLTEDNNLPMPRKIEQGNVVNSIVSPGCVIKGHVENSILSPGVRVDDEAVVRNSVLMANVSVGYHSVVDRCILDDGVNIGKFCYVGFGGNLKRGEQILLYWGKT